MGDFIDDLERQALLDDYISKAVERETSDLQREYRNVIQENKEMKERHDLVLKECADMRKSINDSQVRRMMNMNANNKPMNTSSDICSGNRRGGAGGGTGGGDRTTCTTPDTAAVSSQYEVWNDGTRKSKNNGILLSKLGSGLSGSASASASASGQGSVSFATDDGVGEERERGNNKSNSHRRTAQMYGLIKLSKTTGLSSASAYINGSGGNHNNPKHSASSSDAMTKLDGDAFTIMMLAQICSKEWFLGIFAFVLQMAILGFGPLYVFLFDPSNYQGTNSPLNVPYDVPLSLHITQFLAIILSLLSDNDIVTSIHTLLALRYDDVDWDVMMMSTRTVMRTGTGTATGGDGKGTSSSSGKVKIKVKGKDGNGRKVQDNQQQLQQQLQEEHNTYVVWLFRIVLPNILKLIAGTIVAFTNFIIVVQSIDAVELLKDLTALLVISRIDDFLFNIAQYGYLGRDLYEKANHSKNVQIGLKPERTCCGSFSIPIKSIVMGFLYVSLMGGWTWVVVGQVNGTFFEKSFPYCVVEKNMIQKFQDGSCDGGILNTRECAFDGGDCLNYNAQYPNCDADDPFKIGDGECDVEYNTEKCFFDGSDCCAYLNDIRLGDGQCHAGLFSTIACGYDDGDCEVFRKQYPRCNVDFIAESFPFDGPVPILGNGICESNAYNNEDCGYEGGDCLTCNREVYDLTLTGDGICQGGMHNSLECNYDAGDCESFNKRYPNCQASVEELIPQNRTEMKSTPIIGDGICNSFLYNSLACGYEDGDCLGCNNLIDDLTKIGDGTCNGQFYMSSICDLDGGDCKDCPYNRFEIGDGWCDPEHNVPECSFDGTDCSVFNERYTDCHVVHPSLLGNGICQIYGGYDTETCRFDGGDCTAKSRKYAMKPLSIYLADSVELSEINRQSKGWRLYGSVDYLNHNEAWDVNKLQFFADEECSSSITINDENIVSSGYQNMYQYFPSNAFDDRDDFFWRGLPDKNNNFYIGSTFDNVTSPAVKCVKFEQKQSGMVRIQLQALTDKDQWIAVYNVESIPAIHDTFTLQFSEKLLMESSQWLQIHHDIYCEPYRECSSPIISGNGKRVAIISWRKKTWIGLLERFWYASIFEENSSTKVWEKVHNNVEIGRGSRMSISHDGDRIVFFDDIEYPGTLRIYEDNGFDWVQVHQEITDELGDFFSLSSQTPVRTSISKDGTRVVSSIQNTIKIYEDNGEVWTLVHAKIGHGATIESIELISISDDGMRLASLVGKNGKKFVRIYQDNGTAWEIVYQDITNESTLGTLKSALMSSNGKRVVVQLSQEDKEEKSRFIQVFEDIGDSWEVVHEVVEVGESWGAINATTVSSDGMMVAITTTHLNNAGYVKKYSHMMEDTGVKWNIVRGIITADKGMTSFALSSDGTKLAIGNHNSAAIYGFKTYDVALFQSSSQSSLNANSLKAAASYAVDGDTLSPSMTSKEWDPWWRVHLTDLHFIHEVKVLQNNFDEFTLKIYVNNVEHPVWTYNHISSDLNESSQPNSSDTKAASLGVPNVLGDIVEITIPNRDIALSLNEVNIYGSILSQQKQRAVPSWVQVGDDINNGERGRQYVAMAEDTNRIIIGVPYSGEGDINQKPGFVRVFKQNRVLKWVQVHDDILGLLPNDKFGSSVSMSKDGNRIAVGATNPKGINGEKYGSVRIFQDNGNSWDQIHQVIEGENPRDFAVYTSISGDGMRVAIGAISNDNNGIRSGQVRIFYDDGLTWNQLYQNIDGEAAGDRFGSSVSFSGNGKRIAIGARYNDGSGLDSGHVRVYFDNGKAWEQVHGDLDGQEAGDQMGIAVSLSNNGARVATGTASGYVRVYEDNGLDWVQVHQYLHNEEGLLSGSLALSKNGRRIAVSSGSLVRVFKDGGNSWVQINRDIIGSGLDTQFGRSIAIGNNGKRIIASGDSYVGVYRTFVPNNKALYMKASQSSSYSDSLRHAAMNAVDGNSNSTSLTANEWEPWWRVHLDDLYSIETITVYKREDCCQERLEGIVANIYHSEIGLVWTSASSDDDFVSILNSDVQINYFDDRIKFTVSNGVVGDMIELKIPDRFEILSLADVAVSGELAMP